MSVSWGSSLRHYSLSVLKSWCRRMISSKSVHQVGNFLLAAQRFVVLQHTRTIAESCPVPPWTDETFSGSHNMELLRYAGCWSSGYYVPVRSWWETCEVSRIFCILSMSVFANYRNHLLCRSLLKSNIVCQNVLLELIVFRVISFPSTVLCRPTAMGAFSVIVPGTV